MPSDHPLPVGLADVVEAVTGRRPALLGEPYGADMRLFVNDGDTPCVIFGPGDVKVAHSADEHVPLDEVETCARVLVAWVRRRARRFVARSASRSRDRRRRATTSSSRDDDDRGPEEPERRVARAARTTPEPRLATAAELQISASVRPWTRVRSASDRPWVSRAEPAT